MDKKDLRNLKVRYALWLYKIAKDELDKIERKFTQLALDKIILCELEKSPQAGKLKSFIQEFATYVRNKENDGLSLKFENNALKPEYEFLVLKLKAVEKAIAQELGKEALRGIKSLYEQEMTERILKSTEHK